jgi:hypothetical protein
MAYFTAFPKVQYLFNIGGVDQLVVLKDVILNVRFRPDVLNRVELFDDYLIKEGATPEEISEILYGDPKFHWTIMLINGKFDRINDWPMSDRAVEDYTFKKYLTSPLDLPEDIIYEPKILYGEILYREDYTGLDCNPDTPFSHEVTNIEYEMTLNESKRQIKIINPKLIEQVSQELRVAFS